LINKNRIICIIPARKGSKGLKDKNIKKLNGVPLIAWSINIAKKCKFIDEIIVSTDSVKISKIAKKYGAKVPFLRPKKFATDKSSSFSVIKHAIDFYKKKKVFFDYILLLEPTSPFRSLNDLNKFIIKIFKNKIESMVTVTKVEKNHPLFLYYINKKNILIPYIKNLQRLYIRRQDLKPLFYLEGSIYMSKISILLKHKSFYHKKTQAFQIEKMKSLEIDDIDDFNLAKFYAKKFKII
jgi:CMP-N,N'-diacetyllegionaminic acid synthase